MTELNPENCKNCSSKCAYDCAQLQYTIQHRTVLIIFPLISRKIRRKAHISGHELHIAKNSSFGYISVVDIMG